MKYGVADIDVVTTAPAFEQERASVHRSLVKAREGLESSLAALREKVMGAAHMLTSNESDLSSEGVLVFEEEEEPPPSTLASPGRALRLHSSPGHRLGNSPDLAVLITEEAK